MSLDSMIVRNKVASKLRMSSASRIDTYTNQLLDNTTLTCEGRAKSIEGYRQAIADMQEMNTNLIMEVLNEVAGAENIE